MKELQSKTSSELQKILSETRAKLRDMRFQVMSDQYKQVHEIKELKKLIAKIMTLLNRPKSGVQSVNKKTDSQKDLNK